ncbi:autotransporter outer membrane beta-barrel domain-containing protein [Yersinia alsatica]|uniref:Autotransporter outer membrane beta-barrel domain-containing protein n=2 Tax=Yersinia alsatica TaxID=2890317 RepID=A0ABY5UJH8_9GAMM|nr:autotransporter outer membrane beta-barrel domain-containing protein [Yersinia alsatica]UWM43597.1 autotransporter outer membrane beta-barrel domain-containing protein [Yersinia alsatica]
MAFTPNVIEQEVSGESLYEREIQNIGMNGIANGTTANIQGVQNVNEGGTTNDTILSNGTQNVNNGGVANGTTINKGYQYIKDGGIANGGTLNDGYQTVQGGGLANGVTINGGEQTVREGGIDRDAIINGGRQYLYKGGIAIDATTNGGSQIVDGGAIAYNTTVNRGYQHVNPEGTTYGSTVNGGYQYVLGTTHDTTITGGYQSVYDGGIANITTITGGYQTIYGGGIANITTISGGRQEIRGTANSTTLYGGSQIIHGVGVANDTLVNNGSQHVTGTANNTIFNNSGEQTLYGGGITNNTTFNDGSRLIGSGGTLAGQTVVNDLATVVSPTQNLQNEGELIFQRSADFSLNFNLAGTGSLIQNGPHVLTLSAASSYTGATHINYGALKAGANNVFSTTSDYTTSSDGTLDLDGYNQTLQSLNNGGAVSFGGIGGNTLTITGDYIGNNGLLNMNSVLEDDDSVTDKLIIGGNTSGNTYVQVNNLGGSGAPTLNGIELITVAGNSDGEFTQRGRIVAGAYDYYLERGIGSNEANWYLSNAIRTSMPGPGAPQAPEPPIVERPEIPESPIAELPEIPESPIVELPEISLPPVDSLGTPQPMIERPEASGYSANLAAANNMFVTRLHDRLGETHYIDALTGEQKVTSLWLRNEGGHNRSRDSQDQLRTQSNRYVMQLGGDIAQWSHNGADRFHLGLMAGYGNSKSTTESRLSGYSARASVDGYSTGVYGTWYANSADKTGLYVDSWAQYSWFNNTVNGQDLAVEKYKSKGVTASVESGYTFKVGENAAKSASYFIQPKAQVTWMGVKADDHKEANGTNVSGEGNGNIQTRLGVKAFMNSYADQDKGKDREFQPFVEANWIHNTKDFGTTMDGITVKQDGAANIAELKLGVEGQLSKKVNVWGNVGQQVGNKGYSDTAVMLGVKYNF